MRARTRHPPLERFRVPASRSSDDRPIQSLVVGVSQGLAGRVTITTSRSPSRTPSSARTEGSSCPASTSMRAIVRSRCRAQRLEVCSAIGAVEPGMGRGDHARAGTGGEQVAEAGDRGRACSAMEQQERLLRSRSATCTLVPSPRSCAVTPGAHRRSEGKVLVEVMLESCKSARPSKREGHSSWDPGTPRQG